MSASQVERGVRGAPVLDGRRLVLAVLLCAGTGWALLLARHGLPDPGVSAGWAGWAGCSHHGSAAGCVPAPVTTGPPATTLPAEPGALTPARVLDVLTGWIVMVVAMMLPPALPLVRVVGRLVARQSRPGLLLACTVLAFVAVWTLAGVVLVAVDALVVAADPVVLREHPQLVSGLATITAGVYQFTPLKRACLTACRSPVAIAATTWTGLQPPAISAARIGMRFGLVCVGCCWALMLLTLAIGVAAMPVMVAAALLMALERLAPRSRDLVAVLGVMAIVLGSLILLGWLPYGLPVLKGHH